MKDLTMKRLFFFMVFALCTASAHAEKADSNKPTNIESNQMTHDDVKQVTIFTGNVIMTRGTLLAKAEKVVVTQDPEGYQYAIFYAAPGKLASYRQKRDGGPNLWMEGYGERVEYDNKTEIAKFFSRAKLKRLEGKRTTDEVNGESITYDSKTEFFTVHNTKKGVSRPGAGRIKVILQPKDKALKGDKKATGTSRTVRTFPARAETGNASIKGDAANNDKSSIAEKDTSTEKSRAAGNGDLADKSTAGSDMSNTNNEGK